MPYLTLILPAYNEARTIAGTIGAAVEFFKASGITYEIIVAADGTDGTREVVAGMSREDPALRVIGRNERSGKGRGIREAVALATGDFIGYADADNKVPIEEFNLVRPYLEEGCPVVIGSRAAAGAKIERYQPLYRRIGSRGFAVFMHLVVGLWGVSDTQCGFKFFPAAVARELFRLQKVDGYMFDVEILAIAECLGYPIREVPIRWRDDADSRLQLVAGNLRNVRDIFSIGLRRRLGRITQR